MSSSKKDRSTAPRVGTRPSKARHVDDRNVKPPAGYRRAGKPKPGERAMREQLAARSSPLEAIADRVLCDCGHAYEDHDEDDGCSECACQAWSPVDAGARAGVASQTTIDGTDGGPAPAASPSVHGDAAGTPVQEEDEPPPPPGDPWWTTEREKAFDMALQGVPQHQVAAALSRDRHTVARWMDDERFVRRLFEENAARFKASRQRRAMQTVRLTDKAERLADKMMGKAIELAEKGKDDLGTRLAARDWLQEFRENSRREDEIYGVGGQRVDVNVHGDVQHKHDHKVEANINFKTFLTTALRAQGIDPDAEEIDGERADEAIAVIAERALSEGTFLDELVEREKTDQLAPVLKQR